MQIKMWCYHLQPQISSLDGSGGLFYQYDLILISEWKRNHMVSKVWDETTYPFPNFNSAAIEIYDWISHYIPQFIMDVITYPYWDWS